MLLSATDSIAPFAFKEWALVCEALGSGDQSLLLRKGGIAEGKKGFGFEHQEFFLFPTWFHGQVEKTRPRRPSAILSEAPDVLNLEYVASLEWSDFVTDRKKLAELAALHILHESVIEERFHYKHPKNEPGIYVAFVRIYRLDTPFQLTMEKRFGGCRSWVQLPENLLSQSTEAANNCVAPVLAPSSTLSTLLRCAPSAPCSSSASATLKIGPKMTLGTLVSVLSDEEHAGRRAFLDNIIKKD